MKILFTLSYSIMGKIKHRHYGTQLLIAHVAEEHRTGFTPLEL